jgi:hypothetical protein
MALHHFGYDPSERGDRQLEDYLYDVATARGYSRHEPSGLKKLIEWAGYTDRLILEASLGDIRREIDQDRVCIIHAYSTGFGHIFVVDGYDGRVFNCQDPWGEWHPWWYGDGGEDVRYSDRMIAACAGSWSYGQAQAVYSDSESDPADVGSIWLHSIGPRVEGV